MPIAFTTSRMVSALVVTTGDEVVSAESSIRGQGMLIVKVGVPWDLMKTNTICPHERGDSYNIISIQAS